MIPILVLMASACNGQNATNSVAANTTIADSVTTHISQLEGHYNAQDDAWENPDTTYEERITFDGENFAFFRKISNDGTPELMGIIDKTGKVRVQPIYSSLVLQPTYGFWEVQDSKQNIGLVNREGVEIAKPQYQMVFLHREIMDIDSTVIKVSKDEKQGFINATGALIVPFKYESLELVGKNRIMYMDAPQRWGIMDFNGKIITEAVFTHTNIFKDGKTTLQKADGENYIVHDDGRIEKQ